MEVTTSSTNNLHVRVYKVYEITQKKLSYLFNNVFLKSSISIMYFCGHVNFVNSFKKDVFKTALIDTL